MALKEKLEELKRRFEAEAPPEALSVMKRATASLVDSGILDRVLEEGDRAPDFALPDTEGEMFRASGAWERGPLVVTFYRGAW